MASNTLPVLSPIFSTALGSALDREIAELEKAVRRAEAHVHLGRCWFDDGHSDCRERAVVHQLGTDFEYCLRHFEAVSRG